MPDATLGGDAELGRDAGLCEATLPEAPGSDAGVQALILMRTRRGAGGWARGSRKELCFRFNLREATCILQVLRKT